MTKSQLYTEYIFFFFFFFFFTFTFESVLRGDDIILPNFQNPECVKMPKKKLPKQKIPEKLKLTKLQFRERKENYLSACWHIRTFENSAKLCHLVISGKNIFPNFLFFREIEISAILIFWGIFCFGNYFFGILTHSGF